MIDLTADSQVPPSHSVPSSRSSSPGDGCEPCPMCGKRFDSSVIQLHAEQCEGPDSDHDYQMSESIARYATSVTRQKSADSRSPLSMQRRGRVRQSYQPSLLQLVNKDKELSKEDDIDSSTTEGEYKLKLFQKSNVFFLCIPLCV